MEYKLIAQDFVSGIAIYDLKDPEEVQEFKWVIREEDVPSKECFALLKIIIENNWCSIDRITVTEMELFEKSKMEHSNFIKSFTELLEVKIRMVDEGELTDTFFVHL